MAMTSRERMLTALANGRPDRLPCQVHGWMYYYLNHYLGGIDGWQAFERFGMDFAIYVSPACRFAEADQAKWQCTRVDLGLDAEGDHRWEESVVTPKGTLHRAGEFNEITGWETEPLVKNERDFEIWNEFLPMPVAVDITPVKQVRERLGDRGIVRSHPYSFGQGSPWQSLCTLVGTEPAIWWAIDKPEFVHHVLGEMLKKTLRVTEMWQGTPADMIEVGGGAGSNTVISPALHAEFCTPYDRRQVDALHAAGYRVVYHLCGGLMKMLDNVVANGSDGLETMTPASMGGDCDLAECTRLVGDKLFFVGGFDQNRGFEHGSPATVREIVHELHSACPDGGYICSPSDHFFHGDPANLQAFADAVKECVY